MSPQDQLVSWLNSAYAMEQNLAKVLENHAKDAKDHPEIRQRTELHLRETKRHAEEVERCLQILGEKPSNLKSALGNIMGMVQGASTGMFRDEIVKNVLGDYASEHFEIACYRSLVAAAEQLDQPEIARTCSEILAEEQAMAQWLEERIPEVTQVALGQMART